MLRAKLSEKELVVDILSLSFFDNKSVNYIIKQDKKKEQRIRALMSYSFEICYSFGNVFLSENKKACALILLPDKKKTTLKTILLDFNLMLSAIGFSNIKKAMSRESAIKKIHPKSLIYYLWFIGVEPDDQGKGIGTKLMNDVIKEAEINHRLIYLETSTLKNIPWYEKLGFVVYHKLDFGYELFCMKKV